jgi:hypothetical protein
LNENSGEEVGIQMTKNRSVGFRFWYFGELFIILHLCGIVHPTWQFIEWQISTWWWVPFFYLIDLGEHRQWKQEIKEKV